MTDSNDRSGWMLQAEPPDAPARRSMTRRRFLLGGLAGAAGGLSLGSAAAYNARYVNPYRPVLERQDIPLPQEHEGLAGLRIAFVADTHLGPTFSQEDVARATALIGAERPDLVLLGGDYISESPRFISQAADVLGEFARSAPLGGIAVLGNHDVANVAHRVADGLSDAGIIVLRNAAARVDTGRGELWIAGVDEAIVAHADPVATFARIPLGSATLALWHEPDFAARTAALGAFAQLSGHSHGGQVRLPGVGPLVLPPGGRNFVQGLNYAAGMPVYTSRGVGVYRPPLRLNCPPEVTLITLIAGTR